MTSSTETRAHGDYEEEMRLRRSVVADGYSSAHSCQHCEELVIVPRKLYFGPEYGKEVNETVVSREEVRQRAAAGCKLWSLVSDEVDYEILKRKRKSLAAGIPGTVALSDSEAQALEELRDRCLSRFTDAYCGSPNKARVHYVRLRFHYITSEWFGPACLKMEILAHGSGLEFRVNIHFTVFALPGGPQISTNPYAVASPVNVEPGSAQSFQLIRSWIQKCALKHGRGISEHYPSSMPTMLLRVDSVDECGLIRLVELIPGEKQQYLALSYCWGPNSQKKILTKANVDKFIRDGIPLEELDATIQDAIRVTRELDYHYLWTDALCIVQDDPDIKHGEMDRMDIIYENASITIVAARASSVSEGFLTQRQPAGVLTPEKVFKVAYKHPDLEEQQSVVESWIVLVPEEEENWASPQEPWESRAWTLQEDLLSRRQLRFGKRQTSWVCYCSQEPYEDFDGWFWADLEYARRSGRNDKQVGRMLQQPDRIESVDKARDYWNYLVVNYSRRALSYGEDRLPAIAAVSSRMASVLGDEYWCGIWKSNAAWELLWRPYKQAVDATNTQEADSYGRGEPSWTWASHESGASFSGINRHQFRVDVNFEIVEHVAEYKSPTHIYGAVTAAQLRVRGLVTSAPFGLQECNAVKYGVSLFWVFGRPSMAQFGEGLEGRLRRVFLSKAILHLDRSPHDLLADPKRNIQNKQIVLLLVSYKEASAPHKPHMSGPSGLVLLNEGGNKFSRLGTFDVLFLQATERDYYGVDIRTEDGFRKSFLDFWGGQTSVQEIVLI